MKLSIKFLGTGSVMGVPVWNCNCKVCKSNNIKDKRYRSSVLININDKNIIIDFGPDFRNQLIENNIKKIDYAFLTHAHRDHISGVENLATAKDVKFMAPKDVLSEFHQKEGTSNGWLKARNKTIVIQNFKPLIIENIKFVILNIRKYYKNI